MASANTTDIAGEEEAQEQEVEEKTSAASVCNASHLPELRLVLLGWRWPGKSLTGNTILGREEFRLERAAEFSVKRQTEVAGRQVTVVDTPGWFSSQNTPESYQQEMVRAISMCAPGPHAFLLVIPVGMFTDTDRARIEENLALFGERVWRHMLVVFAWSPGLRDMPIERHIRREGRDLQLVLERCQNRYHVIDNHVFGEHPQLPLLMEKVEKMVAEEGGFYGAEEEQTTTAKVHADGCDLGSKPKQNCSTVVTKSLEAAVPQQATNGESRTMTD